MWFIISSGWRHRDGSSWLSHGNHVTFTLCFVQLPPLVLLACELENILFSSKQTFLTSCKSKQSAGSRLRVATSRGSERVQHVWRDKPRRSAPRPSTSWPPASLFSIIHTDRGACVREECRVSSHLFSCGGNVSSQAIFSGETGVGSR